MIANLDMNGKKAEKKDWRENENLVEKDNVGNMENKMEEDTVGARSDEEDLDNGPSKATVKSKGRKWKLRARNTKGEGANNITFVESKRHNSEGHGPSLESKKKGVSSPKKQP